MKSIVRRDTGKTWRQYIRQLAVDEGVAAPTDEDARRLDRRRKKRVSNDDWQSRPALRAARTRGSMTDVLSIATDSTCCATSQSARAHSSSGGRAERADIGRRVGAGGTANPVFGTADIDAGHLRPHHGQRRGRRRVRFLLLLFGCSTIFTSVVAMAAARGGTIRGDSDLGECMRRLPHTSPMNARRLGPTLSMGTRQLQ